jgi:hypothetical protein
MNNKIKGFMKSTESVKWCRKIKTKREKNEWFRVGWAYAILPDKGYGIEQSNFRAFVWRVHLHLSRKCFKDWFSLKKWTNKINCSLVLCKKGGWGRGKRKRTKVIKSGRERREGEEGSV